MASTEELRAIANNPNLDAEQRAIAAKLLATMEKPAPVSIEEMLKQTFSDIDAKAAAYRADQLERFMVCSACCLKQSRDNEICELCGASGPWESPVPDSPERTSYIAAATVYSDAQLQDHIARDSMNLGFVQHCAKVLELRGVERVRSFWERAGFSLTGAPLNK